MGYKTIVGLEIHVELKTKTKAFCGCANEFGSEPNTNTCPVCLGLPGAMPVLNRNVVNFAIKAGLSLHCKIANLTKMDRKNYFYPDLRKGFQISQADRPICENGYIEIKSGDEAKKVRIQRIQMEEDTGKSLHTEDGSTLLDYNRAGVPLIEIVTYPDMSSGDEAKKFLESLKEIMIYTEVSDCKMEEGSLRCDVNVNVVDEESGKKTCVTEIKNVASFRAVARAIDFETDRHINALKSGEVFVKETRRWDDTSGQTFLMRKKTTVSDYRFAPEGDIPFIKISDYEIDSIKREMPELPEAKRERFIREYKIPNYDAEILTSSKSLSDFYEKTVSHLNEPVVISNWILGEVLRRLNEDNLEFNQLKFNDEDLSALIKYVVEGKINNNTAKKILREMYEAGNKPEHIINRDGLIQISDTAFIESIVDSVLSQNPQSLEDIKNGKDRAFGFLVGQVMKQSKGKANPQLVNQILKSKIQV